MCGHPPFTAQIILNGHEYVAREAVREGIGFRKDGNCFTEVADAARLAEVADTLFAESIVGRLSRVCERWIYSACLCFALDLAAQQKSGFRYAYSVYQGEYSGNLLFTRGSELEEIFQGVIDRTRTQLNVKQLRTILGAKKRPSQRAGKNVHREEVVIERPAYDMTVSKIHFGRITAKFYTKGERVLRIEVIIHNARALFCGHSLERFPEIIKRLSGILNRFLDAVRCVDIACIGEARLDEWPCASRVGRMRVGGVDINKPRMRAVIEGVIELAAAPRGFTVSDLAVKMTSISGSKGGAYTPRKAAYDLKKLRGKNIVHKPEGSRRYEVVPEDLQAIAALPLLREKVIKPVLAGAGRPKCGPKPKTQSPIDTHYRILHHEMRHLFQTIGIAA